MIAISEFTANVKKVEDDNGAVTGTGIFDVLMNTATKHLQVQFDSGKINGELYANAYIQVYQATLQAALQAWLQKGVAEADIALKLAEIPLKEKELALKTAQTNLTLAEIPLKEEQINLAKAEISLKEKQLELVDVQSALLDKQINSEDAKKDLYRRQIEGFDEDYKQKILKIMMDSWAVGFSVSKDSFQANGIPATMQKTTIDDLYNSYIRTDFDNYQYVRTDKTITGSDTTM